MANNTFRDSVNSLGWSRRDPDFPVRTQDTSVFSRLQSLNPFGQGGYVQLPTHNDASGAPLPAPNRREEQEGYFACKFMLSLPLVTHDPTILPSCSMIQVTKCEFLRREGFSTTYLSRRLQSDRRRSQPTLTASDYSKSMGSDAHFRCLQSGCCRLLPDLLLPIPRTLAQAPKICRPVSCLPSVLSAFLRILRSYLPPPPVLSLPPLCALSSPGFYSSQSNSALA